MRVLFVFFVPILRHVGGTQKVIDSLTLELQRRGHEVSFLNYLYGRIPEDYRFPAPQYYIDVRKLPKEQWAEEYRRILDERRIDVVVNLSNDEWVRFFLAHTPAGIRRISVNHLQPFAGFEHIGKSYRVMPAATLKEKVLKYMGIVAPALVRWLLGKPERAGIDSLVGLSDNYCVLCRPYVERIVRYHPSVDRGKLCYIPNPAPYQVAEQQPALKRNVILFVGRLSNYPKNLISFVRVWERLEKTNHGWRAVVVGRGQCLEEMRRYVERHGISRLSFEGMQTDVAPYYQEAKVVCGTSFFESWNMSLVEGMCYGCVPVAYASYEGTAELIDDGINGFLVRPFDEEEMASRIQQLIDSPSLLSRYSEAAVAKARQYDIGNITDQWEQLLRRP